MFNGIEGKSKLGKTRQGSSKTTLTLLFFDWCSKPSRQFDPCSAPLDWVAKSLVEVFLNIAQTLAFAAYITAVGHLFRVLWILPKSINLFCVVSARTCFIFLVCGRRCLEIYTRVYARNTKSSREEVTLLPCAGYHWIHKHRDTPRTYFSSGLKNCYGQQGGRSLVPGWLFLVLPSWQQKKIFISTTESASLIPTTALSRWIVGFVWRAYERLGIQMPPTHPGLCTQVCLLPKNIMPNRDIFPRRTGIPRTHGWHFQPCTLDGDISSSFHRK